MRRITLIIEDDVESDSDDSTVESKQIRRMTFFPTTLKQVQQLLSVPGSFRMLGFSAHQVELVEVVKSKPVEHYNFIPE